MFNNDVILGPGKHSVDINAQEASQKVQEVIQRSKTDPKTLSVRLQGTINGFRTSVPQSLLLSRLDILLLQV